MANDQMTTVILWPLEYSMSGYIVGKGQSYPMEDKSKVYFTFNLPLNINILQVVTSSNTTCLLSRCGQVISWGVSSGHSHSKTPTVIPSFASNIIIDVAAGESHSLLIRGW